MGDLVILELPEVELDQIARISIAFPVTEKFVAVTVDSSLAFKPVLERFTKDYDGLDGNRPEGWRATIDLSNWRQFLAVEDETPVGSILIAFDTPGADMLKGRDDLAAIWDLRVAPEARGRGIGTALFERAEAWARGQGCSELKVETQDINAAACRFYAGMGFALVEQNASAYPQCPDETQLIWVKSLIPATA